MVSSLHATFCDAASSTTPMMSLSFATTKSSPSILISGTRPFSEQHSIADFDIQRMKFSVIASRTRPSGNDLAFHWLFLGGIGDNDAALRLLLLLDAADQNAVLQWSKFHWSPP